MNMILWRETNGIPLARLSAMLELPRSADGHLSRIERGQVWIGAELAVRIEAVSTTLGPEPVTIRDHLEAWRKAHPEEVQQSRRLGRAALGSHRSAARAKRVKEALNGNGSSKGKEEIPKGEWRPRKRGQVAAP